MGTKRRTISMVSKPSAATSKKAERQPSVWPIYVASGTPKIFATVKPIRTRATAWPRLSGSARAAATSAATPK